MTLQIRRADGDDAGDRSQLLALIEAYDAELPEDLRLARVRFPRGQWFVAENDGVAAGCVVVVELEPGTCEVKRLYVSPAARGTGAGEALMHAAIAYARENDYERIALDTHRERLQAAFALYEKLGFTECEQFEAPEYENPTYMELRLR